MEVDRTLGGANPGSDLRQRDATKAESGKLGGGCIQQ